jgi:hypothetical protein
MFSNVKLRAACPIKRYSLPNDPAVCCMNDTNDAIAGNQRAGDEVELTAEDLRALSLGSMGQPLHDQIAPSTQAPANVPRQSGSAVRKAISRVGLPVAVIMAATGLTGGYTYLTGAGAGHFSTLAVTQSLPQPKWAATKHEEEPVHFANPFDATEIFEFPADTTEAEAREAVAGFLIERAMYRQASVERKPASNR